MRPAKILLIAGLTLTSVSVWGQDSLNVSRVGGLYYWNSAWDVVISGDLAFVLTPSTGVRIVDIADPFQPHEIGCFDSSAGSVVTAEGSAYVYMSRGYHLSVVDVSDPSSPVTTGTWDAPNGIYQLAVNGNYLAAEGPEALYLLDISTPENPILADTLQISGETHYLAYEGDYVYFIGTLAGTNLNIVDVSRPDSIFVAGTLAPISGYAIDTADDLVYIASTTQLKVVDVSNPAAPTMVSTLPLSPYPWDIAVSGDYAYLAYFQWTLLPSGLEIIDISDPAQPAVVSNYLVSEAAYSVALHENSAVIADAGVGLNLADISNPLAPMAQGALNAVGYVGSIMVLDDIAYVPTSISPQGLRIFDVSHPDSLVELGSWTPDEGVGPITQWGDCTVVIYDFPSFLGILDLTDPSAPVELGSVSIPGEHPIFRVATYNDHAYIAKGLDGLVIVDLSTPANPQVVANVSFPDAVMDLAMSGHYLYVASGHYNALMIYDISIPQSPTQIGECPVGENVERLAIWSDYAYAVLHEFGLVIIDVSNPNAPALVGSYPSSEDLKDIFADEGFVFIADGYEMFRVINATDPSSPYECGFHTFPGGWMHHVTAEGIFAYVSGDSRLEIYDCSAALPVSPWEIAPSHPSSFALYPPHPNPFNPSAVASFELRVPSYVNLRVYDTAGRRVATLVDSWKPAGKHQAIFDGADLPSGIYLARLTAGDFQQTQKLVLLK